MKKIKTLVVMVLLAILMSNPAEAKPLGMKQKAMLATAFSISFAYYVVTCYELSQQGYDDCWW